MDLQAREDSVAAAACVDADTRVAHVLNGSMGSGTKVQSSWPYSILVAGSIRRSVSTMTLGQVTSEVTENVRRFGVGPVARDVAYRAASRLIPLTLLKAIAAEARDVDPEWFMAGRLLTRFAFEPELLEAADDPEWGPVLSHAAVEDYFANGDRCVGCFDGDRLVSIGWYAQRAIPISDLYHLQFDADWVYMHHQHTLPSYRGRQLRAAAVSWAVHQYTDEGARGLISSVDAGDFTLLRSLQRLGFRVFGDICVAVVAGREITYVSPGCRAYQYSLAQVRGTAEP